MPTSAQATESGIRFDREKLLDTVHFIIESCSDRPDVLGKTKLHKCLYYTDMLHFFVTGSPVTGVEYVKAPFGPTARYLDWALNELRDRQLIDFEIEQYFGLGKYRYTSKRPLKTNRLSEAEKALMNEVMAFVCEHSAREISEFSHAQPWQEAQMGDRIPYATAYQLVPGTTPTRADLDWAGAQSEVVLQRRRA